MLEICHVGRLVKAKVTDDGDRYNVVRGRAGGGRASQRNISMRIPSGIKSSTHVFLCFLFFFWERLTASYE